MGAWNILSLRDDNRIPLLSLELSRLGVDIVALSEVRRPGSGEINVGGYTYYWSGRSDGHHLQGVAVAVSDRLTPMVVEVTSVNERIMRLRIKHSMGVVSLVSIYAPTNVSDVSVREAFYAQLQSVVDGCPGRDTLLVLGDFNAQTGMDRDGYEACVGPHGSGTRCQNGSMLLDFAKGRGLRVAGSWFQRPESHRWTFYSNAGGTPREIDHILVNGRWRLLHNCRVYQSAQFFNADHRLIIATLKLRIKSKRMPRSGQLKLDLDSLKDARVAEEFALGLGEGLRDLGDSDDPEVLWGGFKTTTLEVAGRCLGTPCRARKSFVSAETLDIIEKSRRARLDGRAELSRELRRATVRSLRMDKEAHVRGVCDRVEHHLWSSDSRPAYRGIRELRSSKSAPRSATIKAANGDLLTETSEVGARWAGYFERLYQADPPSSELHCCETVPLIANPPINCEPPTLVETQAAVKQLKSGKAAGVCGIAAELLKGGGEAVILSLHAVLCSAWNTGVIPTDWKKGIIVPIWKGKGDRQDCNNYRGVTLLSVPGKVLARVILGRIRQQLLAHQRPEQSGFTPKKSAIDRILALRVLCERKREFRQGLLAAYVDLRKAFDSVNRDALWRILSLRGVSPELVNLISELYSGTVSAVKCGGTISDFFPVNSGVRQGCVLAPTLFNACMDWVLGRVSESSGCGAAFGDVRISDLDFADDAVIFAETLGVLTEALETLSDEAEPLGLSVSWVKTKIQAFNDILGDAVESIPVNGIDVELTERFTYLGSDIHVSTSCVPEVKRRLGCAWGAMDSLNRGVWRSRYLSRMTKVRVFRCLVLPVLLYGCETWTLTGDLSRRLDAFGTMSLRRILGYHWSDFISNDQLLRETKMRHVTCIIRERQLQLYGHVARFSEADPAHQVLSCRDPRGWRRPTGRPPLSWLRQVDRYLGELGMGRATAWGVAIRRPLEYRRRVVAATRTRCACSQT